MAEYKKEDWRVKPPMADVHALAEQFSISPILAHIIVNREITEAEAVERYLSDDLSYVYDPALMKDMDKGSRIMSDKIRNGKKIRIISDYDVDGITSNYILYQGLRKAGADISYDIPHRILDGYGMNVRLVDAAYADGVDTIITCDNGIAAEAAVNRAKELGMTVIVTDHHEVPCVVGADGKKEYQFVKADAIIDPHQPGCGYPYKGLCGAGVAYKFIRHLYRVMELRWEDVDDYMDILALGTVCDIMPLTDENRIFVKHGLRKLTNSTNLGINALKKALGLEDITIEVHHLSFRIGPSLNSTGRLESAKEGLELLLTENAARAQSLAQDMAQLNTVRKEMTDRGVIKATDWVRRDIRLIPTDDGTREIQVGDDKVLVVYMPGIHESIAGLVASKLKESFYRPALVFTDAENGQDLKGSGRSIEAYNMFDKLCEHKDLFVKVGGHPMAAGFTMKRKNFDALREALNRDCGLTDEDLVEKMYVDESCALRQLTLPLYNELAKLEPYGTANPRPLFGIVKLGIRRIRMVGNEAQYARCTFVDGNGTNINAMVFRGKELLDNIKVWFGDEECDKILKGFQNHALIDVLYHVKKNEFNGTVSIQMEPVSIRKSVHYQE